MQRIRMKLDSLHILTDEQLVQMSREGSETAQEILIEKYKGLVKNIAKPYFIVGADNDDVVQEGMIGLFKAITSFEKDRNASFKTFAETCITSQILSAIKKATRQKHQPLNESLSIDNEGSDDNETNLGEALRSLQYDPEESFIYSEEQGQLNQDYRDIFSPMELQVFIEKMQGYDYKEIAVHMGKTEKQIDNALQRIKKKLIDYLEIK